MDALCKYMFIIIETIPNIEHEYLTCFIGHRCFSNNLFIFIRHMKKEIPGSHYFSDFALYCSFEQFTDTNLFTFLHTGQLTSSEHAKCAFIITFVSLSVPTYCILMQLNASFICFTVSVVRQRNEYEIVTETQPIKTTEPALPSKMLICTKILIIEPSSDEIKYT